MRPHRSHSQLNSYQRCGHAHFLTRVLHKPEAPSVWLASGKAFHAATEAVDRDGVLAELPEWLLDTWRDEFTVAFEVELDLIRALHPDESKWRTAGRKTKDKPNGEDVAWWHTAGRDMVAEYALWRARNIDVWEIAEIDGKPAVEVEVTSPLGGVPMRGFVDRLLRSKVDGRLVVMDLKSGSRTPASPMQLATYSIQLEEMIGEPVLWGAFYAARQGELHEPINLSIWTAQLLGKVYNDLDRSIEAGIFMPVIDTHCKGCGVARFCIYTGGSENAA